MSPKSSAHSSAAGHVRQDTDCSLDRVPATTRAEVVHTPSGQGCERQLAQLGILAGATLRVVRAAPLGGPILVEIQGSTVAIGRGLARRVQVKIL